MNFLGNLIWLIFGGFVIAIEYFIASALLFLTIIGIPFAFQTMKLGALALWPFGQHAYIESPGGGSFGCLLNIIWIIFGGIWIALTHLGLGILFAITIIGLPFGIQHFKLASLAISPFGKTVTL
ncbi:MAG: YccF domain-containing protein [Bacteroidota bacterium]